MQTLRVRQILEGMDPEQKTTLKKLLPIKTTSPELNTHPYPSGLLNCLPKDESYSLLGFIAEELLRKPVAEITLDALVQVTRSRYAGLSDASEKKIRASVTTQPFLDCLRSTRKSLESVLRNEGDLLFEDRIVAGSVEGHPDMRNKTQIFEVKLTGMLKQNWSSFLYQVFAYGAIRREAKDLYLVLPLQKIVWHANIEDWDERGAYLKCMQDHATRSLTVGVENGLLAAALCLQHSIGHHAHKAKTMDATITALGDFSKPYQIFLGGPITAKLSIADAELAKARQLVEKTKATVFVHSPYIINLSTKDEDNWQLTLLKKNLSYTRAFGGKGVVVHVGKYVKQEPKAAHEQMRIAIREALEAASPECPLLLETPAGQGTELLTKRTDFLDFVESFQDPRIRMCLDTCHVFASGHSPLEYLQEAIKRPGLLKLVHFNDSQDTCGSCKDRHAFIGTGKIGFEVMEQLAVLCAKNKIPMVIE